jgi:general nucleoside transport system ATP-binding protein
MLAANAITKRFGRTLALAGVDFCARAGEIHALVGENGAGKSTLINIFAGRLRPDYGHVTLDGSVLSAGSPAQALARGIAAVYQSPMLFERMAWEENLALGGFSPQHFNLSKVVAEAQALADELEFTLPPSGAIVERRSVAERVRLEILRALSFRPRVLILDEPTSVLSPAELQPFLRLLRQLRSQRRIVIIVTHKLAEALAVADRVTVLRHGRVAAVRAAALTNEAELAQLMMGSAALPHYTAVSGISPGAPVVELHHVTLKSQNRLALDEVSLTLRAGSIVGIAGVDGNGQDELVAVMARVRAPTSGSVRLCERRDDASDMLAVIPQNRDADSLILDLSLWENLLLSRPLRRQAGARYGWIRRTRTAHLCHELIHRFSVRGRGPKALARSLSGGNRQRFVVARALAAAPAAIVAHDICRGLDLNAAAELRSRLRDYAARGGAVLLISSDLEELLALCHQLYVINRGRLTEVQSERHDLAELGLLMSGASQAARSAGGASEPEAGSSPAAALVSRSPEQSRGPAEGKRVRRTARKGLLEVHVKK